jgi:hypothetical protein
MSPETWSVIIAAGTVLVSIGISYGLTRGDVRALDRRVGVLEARPDSSGSIERIDADVERHEKQIGALQRHLGDAQEDIAVLKDRADRRREPT